MSAILQTLAELFKVPASSRKPPPQPTPPPRPPGPPRLHLARGLHPLEDAQEDDDPGQQQAEAQVPADLPGTADALAALDVQDVAAGGDKGQREWPPLPCSVEQGSGRMQRIPALSTLLPRLCSWEDGLSCPSTQPPSLPPGLPLGFGDSRRLEGGRNEGSGCLCLHMYTHKCTHTCAHPIGGLAGCALLQPLPSVGIPSPRVSFAPRPSPASSV